MPVHRVFVLATTALESGFPRDWGYQHADRFFFDTGATSAAALLEELQQRPEYEASISPGGKMRMDDEYLVQLDMPSVFRKEEDGTLEMVSQLSLALVDVLPEAHDLYVRLLLMPEGACVLLSKLINSGPASNGRYMHAGLEGPSNPFRSITITETVLPLASPFDLGQRVQAFKVEAECVATMGQLRNTICDLLDLLPEERFMLLVHVPQGECWHVQQARWHVVVDDSDPMPTVAWSSYSSECLHIQIVRQGTSAVSTVSGKVSTSDAVASSSSSSSSERSTTGIHPQVELQPMPMAHNDSG